LKAENAALIEQKDRLEKENDAFKAKLSSATELKKAIKELKKQAQKVGVSMIKKAQTEKTLEGNQGYIIKDGLATIPAKVRIEVTPAPAAKE
jgi:superfamily II RNA helicase